MLRRNNTSYPALVHIKLRKLYEERDRSDAHLYNYYQYMVRTIMTDPEYGIGSDGNARGLLIYHAMGMGKTRLAIGVALAFDNRRVIIMAAKSLHSNFQTATDEVVAALKCSAPKFKYVSMDAYNSAEQMLRAGVGALDNALLVVDEAHNFFRAIINGGSNARDMYETIMNAKNLRILFLTGTPASKDPFELVPCFNMLAGTVLLPTQYEIFYKHYVDEETKKIKNKDRLANRLVGLVSHVTPARSQNEKKARDDGWFPEQKETIVERVPMSVYQYRLYLIAREQEIAEAKQATVGKKAGIFKAPNLSLPNSGAAMSYHVRSRSLSTYTPPIPTSTVKTLPDSAFTEEYSPKFKLIAQRVKKAEGIVLVYSQFVNMGGLAPLTRYLELEGITNYAIISGEVPPEERQKIVETCTSPANINGDLIKAILVSKTGAEGLDLKNVRETHQIEPYWDKARDEQIKARAVRLRSHDALPREKRDVQPYLYLSVACADVRQSLETQTIDEQFYERALQKYEINESFRKMLTEVCFECELFKYGSCRTCVPTDSMLFHADDPELDIRLPDPCEILQETEISATALTVDGVEYYYIVDATTPFGYVFYKNDDSLGGYVPIDLSDKIIEKLITKI